MNLTDTKGTLGATLTTVAFLPQVWHTFRTKDVSGISLGMYTVLTIGIAHWTVYGWLLSAWPVIMMRVVCGCSRLMRPSSSTPDISGML